MSPKDFLSPLQALLAAIPSCNGLDVRRYGTGFEIAVTFTRERDLINFAARFGVVVTKHIEAKYESMVGYEWLCGERVFDEECLRIRVSGPAHKPGTCTKVLADDRIDAALDGVAKLAHEERQAIPVTSTETAA